MYQTLCFTLSLNPHCNLFLFFFNDNNTNLLPWSSGGQVWNGSDGAKIKVSSGLHSVWFQGTSWGRSGPASRGCEHIQGLERLSSNFSASNSPSDFSHSSSRFFSRQINLLLSYLLVTIFWARFYYFHLQINKPMFQTSISQGLSDQTIQCFLYYLMLHKQNIKYQL